MLAGAMRVKIIFGEETGFSHHDGALALGKARELKFSIRPRKHGALAIEIDLHQGAADGFGGDRINDCSPQSVFVDGRKLLRFEDSVLVDSFGEGDSGGQMWQL